MENLVDILNTYSKSGIPKAHKTPADPDMDEG